MSRITETKAYGNRVFVGGAFLLAVITFSFVFGIGCHSSKSRISFHSSLGSPDAARTLSIEQAIEEVRAYPVPTSVGYGDGASGGYVDPAVFEMLRDELVRALEARRDRGVSMLPSMDDANNQRERRFHGAFSGDRGASGGGRDDPIEIDDILVTPKPDRTNEIRFSEVVLGDYDSNGEVGVSDITPIAQNYGHFVNDGAGDDALDRKIDQSGDGEVGIPDITPIAENYLMTSPAAGAGSAGYDVWRMPADGNGDAELMTNVTADVAQSGGDSTTGYGATRLFSAMDADPVRGTSFLRQINELNAISQRERRFYGASDGTIYNESSNAPSKGRSLSHYNINRSTSSLDSEGNGYANGDYVYYISPHEDGSPDSPPQFAVTVEHQGDFRFAGAPASCRIVVKSWGELTPISYTMDWGVPDNEYTPVPMLTSDPLYQFTYTYTRPGIYCPTATVRGTVRGIEMSITQVAAPVIVEADVPFTPNGLAPSPLGEDIQLNWNEGSGERNGYKVYYSMKRGDSRPILLGTTGPTGNVFQTNLDDMLQYVTADHPVFFKVTAYRQGDGVTTRELESKFSNEVKWPSDVQAPTISISDYDDAFVDLSWTTVPNTTDYEVTGYRVFKSLTSGDANPTLVSGVDPLPETQTTFHYDTLSSETTVYFFARTVSNIGDSGRSNEVLWHRELPEPPVVTNPSATPGNNRVTLNWEAPVDDGFGAIDNIKISYGTKTDHSDELTVVSDLSRNTTQYTLNDTPQHPVANGTRYYFWIFTVRAGKEAAQRVSAVPFNTPPVAGFTTTPQLPYEGEPGDRITFTSSSNDPDGSIVQYAWDFDGDGTLDQTASDLTSVQHTYNDEGNFTPALTVTDDDGGTNTFVASELITIGTGNPVAVTDQTAPTAGNAPLTVNFSAEGSNDPDGYIVKYQWKYYDTDEYHNRTPEGGAASHTYTEIGSYAAMLWVTDNDGKDAYKSVQVRVNQPPFAEAGANPQTGTQPLTVNFNAAGSYDSDGMLTKWEWDFNDDGTFDWESTSDGNAQYTYIDHGDYSSRLRVTDNDNATATDTVSIHVNAPPTADAQANPTSGNVPLIVDFNAGASNDPDGSITLYEWDFNGDGTYDWESPADGDTQYTYDTPGNYTAKLRVTDDDGATGTDTVNIHVNAPPTADAVADHTSGNAPLLVNFNAGTSNDPDGSLVKWEWDFTNDGTYDWESTTNGNAQYTYTTAGDYTAKLQVTDNDGATGTDTVGISVSEGSWHIETVDSDGNVGTDTSLEVVNGYPAISYQDYNTGSNRKLKYVRALNASGSSWGTPLTIDTENDCGDFNSLEIVNGNPAISYHMNAGDDLNYIRALDAEGNSWGTPVTVDLAWTGFCTSLAVVNGNPAISYNDVSPADIKYVRATNADGTAWATPVIVDDSPSGSYYTYTSLVVVNGNPAISYHDTGNYDLKYVRATNADGNSWGTPVTPDSDGIVGKFPSLAIVNGKPAISYLCDTSNEDLRFVQAIDANGDSWGTPISPDDGLDRRGYENSICIVNGYPAISYWDNGLGDLLYVQATDADGSTWGAPVEIETAGDVGRYTSMKVINGFPAISYYDQGNGDLKYAWFG